LQAPNFHITELLQLNRHYTIALELALVLIHLKTKFLIIKLVQKKRGPTNLAGRGRPAWG